MKIFDFDIKKGIYNFEFNDLNTERHSHPVVEIINAVDGTFSLETDRQTKENLVFAMITSNIEHKVVSQDCIVKILMIESHNLLLPNFLKTIVRAEKVSQEGCKQPKLTIFCTLV